MDAALGTEATQALDQILAANVKKDESSTITSEDGRVTVTFEAGTFDQDAECVVVAQDVAKGLAYGPYKIVCQDGNGNDLHKFSKSIYVEFMAPSKDKAATLGFITFDGDTRTMAATTVNAKENIISTKLETLLTFGIARKATPIPVGLYAGGAALLLIVVGCAILIIRRRQQSLARENYLSSQYIPPVGSPQQTAEPEVPLDQQVAPPVHDSNISPLAEAQKRLDNLSDPNPPA